MSAKWRKRVSALSHVRPAHQQVADQLLDLILTGALSCGDRLPSETELAEQFGVSRGTLRAALRVLSGRGLITTTRGATGGTFVARIDVGQVSGSFGNPSPPVDLESTFTASSMLEARRMVEVPAASLAAGRRRREHLEDMTHALEAERGSDRWAQFSRNRSFHEVMIDAAANPTLTLMTAPVFRLVQANFLRSIVEDEVWMRIHQEHRAIFEAIDNQDSLEAGDLMAAHISTLEQVYLE